MSTLLTLWQVLCVIHALYPYALGVAIAYAFKLAWQAALRHAQLVLRAHRQAAALRRRTASTPERQPALSGGRS